MAPRDRLRQLGPQQAYAEVAALRARVEDIVGPNGAWSASEVAEHMRAGDAPTELLRPLLRIHGVREQFCAFARGLGRKSFGMPLRFASEIFRAETYAEGASAQLVALPPELLYLLAREGLLSIDAIVTSLHADTLRQHASSGALRLPADLMHGSVGGLIRCLHCDLLPILPFKGDALRWLERAAATAREVNRRFHTSNGTGEFWLSRLLGHRTRLGEPPRSMRSFAAVLARQIAYVHVADYLPPLSLAEMALLHQHKRAPWADWFVRWRHDDATLLDAVQFGLLEPRLLDLGGPNVARATELLVAHAELPTARAAAALAPLWQEGAGIGPHATAWARGQRSLTHLLDAVVLPTAPPPGIALPPEGQRRNAAYLALCMASFLERARPVAAEPPAPAPPLPAPPAPPPAHATHLVELANEVRRRLAWLPGAERLGIRPPAAASPGVAPPANVAHVVVGPAPGPAPAPALAEVVAVEDVATRDCDACTETLPLAQFVDLDACDHGPRYDRDCFLAYLAANERGSHACPDPDCRRPFGLADALQLGLPFSQRVAWAAHAARDALHAEGPWASCRTVDCLGGRFELQPDPAPLTCGCCGVTAPPLRGRAVRYADLDAAGRAYLDRLVEDIGTTRLARVTQPHGTPPEDEAALHLGHAPRSRPVRECFHCGLATQHNSDCMHMICPPASGGCGGHWNFVDGLHHRSQYELGQARYVPHTSWLVDLGLYDGLTPGQSRIDVVPTVRRNLQRLQQEAAAG